MTALDRLKAVVDNTLHKHPSTGVIVNYSDLAKLIAVAEAAQAYWDCDVDGNTYGVETALEAVLSALKE